LFTFGKESLPTELSALEPQPDKINPATQKAADNFNLLSI
jgi:hypothetical protein